ncbi:translocation/assembly module TamB domain-containing protein [Xanthovirga aplysinae]|uniref:translocation/assembly module TamB domain-containing protein n=1 Tax=Xanthovirga aplysinae TaxID=2529853 RepID=UPI0012BD3ADB|nr:translocation/assembly module TamB domain-containing protein [Xanthovirga aplysinae]MTI31489.1 hypothetical protein [Xanthovirga aplysinae]
MSQVIKKRLLKTVLWLTLTILFLFIALSAAIQLPYIQTKITKKLAHWVTERTSFTFEVAHVNLHWFHQIELENVKIKDTQDSLMIGAKSLRVDLGSLTTLEKEHININQLRLENAEVHLIKNTPTNGFNLNLFVKELNEMGGSGKEKKPKKAPKITIGSARLINSTFSMNMPEKDSIPGQFDYYHFTVDSIQAQLRDFSVDRGKVSFESTQLSGREVQNNFKIHELKTHFSINGSKMAFEQLFLQAGNSTLQDQLIFRYHSYNDFQNFNQIINLEGQLNKSEVYTKDLAVFAPFLLGINDRYLASGHFKGEVNNFKVQDLQLAFGRNSLLKGIVSFQGLPNVSETFADINLSNSQLLGEDLKQYIPQDVLQTLKKFGQTQMNATFQGFPNDFVAEGEFSSKLGYLKTDINLKFEKGHPVEYSGRLKTKDFNLGKLAEDTEFLQFVNLNGEIEGEGFNMEGADFTLNAKIDNIGINHYNYQNLTTNARMAKELFRGKLTIEDPNLKATAVGELDLRKNKNKIDMEINVDTALVHNLGFLEKETFVKTKLNVDLHGLQLDSITGHGSFNDTKVIYDNHPFELKVLKFNSQKNEGERDISIRNEAFDADFKGNYQLSRLSKDLVKTWNEYQLNLLNHSQEINSYYSQKANDKKRNDYQLSYEIYLKDINPFLEALIPELYISKNTSVTGTYKKGYTDIITLNSEIDSLSYNDFGFKNTAFDLSTSKLSDSTNVLAMVYLTSGEQLLKNRHLSQNLTIQGIWNDTHVDFLAQTERGQSENSLNLEGTIDFLPDTTHLSILNSDLRFLGKPWYIAPGNQISLINNRLQIQGLQIYRDEQKIALNGAISPSPYDSIILSIENLQLDNFNEFLEPKLSGVIDGTVSLRDYFNTRLIQNQINIKQLHINHYLAGDFSSYSDWSSSLQRLNLNLQLNRLGKKTIGAEGYYDPYNEENPLNLTARFDQANLNLAEPFIEENFSDIEGTASGEFKISGKLTHPILEGEGIVQNGKLKFNYLNTFYTFDGSIIFDVNEIGVRNLKLHDINQNEATLSGGIFHDGFQNFILSLEGTMDNFQVLNTNYKDNSLYYGEAYGTGNFYVLGAINNLQIYVNATTNKNTKIHMPITSYSADNFQQEDFIHFVNLSDSTALSQKPESNSTDLTGINLNFDLNITPDAYGELIFDKKSGDIIRGRGNGNLKLQIDTKGDFNIIGDLEFTQGNYNFTIPGLINKEFIIEPNSTIKWAGDPYEAQLGIKASYNQLVSLEPVFSYILDPDQNASSETNAQLKRKYPAKVLMDIEGQMLSPDINFELDFSDYPHNISKNGIRLEDAITEFKSRLKADEQELKRQVFSMIILKKLASDNSSLAVGGTVGNSVSELLSNQLSYWLSQVNENLEIDFNLNSIEEDFWETFRLRFSVNLWDGRLRITRDGGFTDVHNQTNINSIVGEWTVEYLITPDGKFRAKLYNTTDLNSNDSNIDSGNSASQGISIMHVQTFNKFKDLFKGNKKRRSSEKEKEKTENTETITPKDSLLNRQIRNTEKKDSTQLN